MKPRLPLQNCETFGLLKMRAAIELEDFERIISIIDDPNRDLELWQQITKYQHINTVELRRAINEKKKPRSKVKPSDHTPIELEII